MIIRFYSHVSAVSAIVDNALSLYKPVAKHRVMSNVAQDFVDLVEELLED